MAPPDQNDSGNQGYQSVPVKRSKVLGPFILDILAEAGRDLKTQHLQAYDRLMAGLVQRGDRDLEGPFRKARATAEQMKEKFGVFKDELEEVDAHVNAIYKMYCKFWAPILQSSSTRSKKGKNRKDVDSGAGDIARKFAEGPNNCHSFSTLNLAAIKASCAYMLHPTFAFAVAYRDLCTIKAIACEHAPTARFFAETMSIAPSFLRVLGEHSDE
jgi:hypothetical protein